MTGGKPWTKRAFSERRILSIGLIYLGVRDFVRERRHEDEGIDWRTTTTDL